MVEFDLLRMDTHSRERLTAWGHRAGARGIYAAVEPLNDGNVCSDEEKGEEHRHGGS